MVLQAPLMILQITLVRSQIALLCLQMVLIHLLAQHHKILSLQQPGS